MQTSRWTGLALPKCVERLSARGAMFEEQLESGSVPLPLASASMFGRGSPSLSGQPARGIMRPRGQKTEYPSAAQR